MSTEARFQEILGTVRDAYGNLEEPIYDFVEQRYAALRHHSIIGDLMSRYYIRDETDLNDHVSMHLRVLHAEGSVVVCLSFIDNWAMLFRLASGSQVYEDVIEPQSSTARTPERDIMSLLQGHGFRLMTKAEAAMPIAMSLFNTDRDEARLYHAIVADDGIVPQALLR